MICVVAKCSIYLKIKLCSLLIMMFLIRENQNLYFQNPFFFWAAGSAPLLQPKISLLCWFLPASRRPNPTPISATALKDPPTLSFAVMDGAYL